MWREFFYFQRSDRRAFIVLLLLAVAGIGVVMLLDGKAFTPMPDTADSLIMARRGYAYRPSARMKGSYGEPRAVSYYVEGRKVERFVFDPNTADSTQLLRLGLSPWQVTNIYKYRAKGGRYRSKEDFANLYGLDIKTYRELEPYIHIGGEYAPASSLNAGIAHEQSDTIQPYPRKLSAGQTIDLNRADTSLLKRVPGVGSGWARRITNYRDRLGGFVSVEQLKDIEGFPVDALVYFEIADRQVRQINVNTMTLNELRRHPYVSFHQAKAIVDFRRLKGSISDLKQLSLLRDFPPELIERLAPYVAY